MTMLKIAICCIAITGAVFFSWATAVHYRATHFQGHTAEEWVDKFRTDSGPIEDALRPKQIITGEEPELMTFEVPIACGLLGDHPDAARVSELELYVDGDGIFGNLGESNGNARLYWDTSHYHNSSGPHQIQVGLLVGGRGGQRLLEIRGPTVTFRLSNPSVMPLRR